MADVVEVVDLRKTYPDGTEAVRGITFSVGEGEFFGFLGPNGAGKSTTIKILITLLRASGGAGPGRRRYCAASRCRTRSR